MECHDATAHITDYLAGTLAVEGLEALRAHTAACAACRHELREAEETWQLLGRIPSVAPDVPAMWTRFDALLAGCQEGLGRRRPIAVPALAAAAVLAIGIGIGRQSAPPATSGADTQMEGLREELRQMRQVMSLSLLQQPSAAARLQGVISIRQIDEPGAEVIAALLDTLTNDPNANVRLATVDALGRFMDHDLVRRRTLEALPRQTSPLVQIALIDFVVESAGVASADALRTLSKDSAVEAAVRTRAVERLRQLGATS